MHTRDSNKRFTADPITNFLNLSLKGKCSQVTHLLMGSSGFQEHPSTCSQRKNTESPYDWERRHGERGWPIFINRVASSSCISSGGTESKAVGRRDTGSNQLVSSQDSATWLLTLTLKMGRGGNFYIRKISKYYKSGPFFPPRRVRHPTGS